MPTAGRVTRATPSPTTKPEPASNASGTPMTAPATAAPMGGVVKPPAPGMAQPAGSRFRAPEAPTMAPRGTPPTTRRLDKTP